MRLLLVTFELSDTSKVLAWQAKLARGLASRCTHVVALTESLGNFVPPPNMDVEVVPRLMTGPLRVLGARWLMNPRVYRLCRAHRIDVCLIHMAMEWAYRLKPALSTASVPTVVWYAHGTVSRRLKVAHACADRMVTSSADGFRLPSRKLSIIGQGIDTSVFRIPPVRALEPEVVYVGRISQRKRLDLVLEVFAKARSLAPEVNLSLRVIGPALSRTDRDYKTALQERARQLGIEHHVQWLEHMPLSELPQIYRTASVHINLSETGSLDKTVLEALACGCPVLTTNAPFADALGSLPGMYVHSTNVQELAQSLLQLYFAREQLQPSVLRDVVVRSHGFEAYVDKLMVVFRDLSLRHLR